MIQRANKDCKYYPCHEKLEDCTFCYCPYYPCLDESLGENFHSEKTGKNIWSCKNCSWIHSSKVVDDIFNSIRENKRHPKLNLKKFHNEEIGIILLAHGSQLKKANNFLLNLIDELKKDWKIVEPSYMQFHHPDISTSVKRIIGAGCKKIIIMPYFLFVGNHVTIDIPEAIKKEEKKYSDVKFTFTKTLGEDSRIAGIVRDKIKEILTECS